jgi:ACS family hexuronate transporter-like MFS transporter
VAGYLLQHGFGYQTLFILVGSFHLIGFVAIVMAGGKIQPLSNRELAEIEA